MTTVSLDQASIDAICACLAQAGSLPSARLYVDSGTQQITDSTSGPPGNIVIWDTMAFDNIGLTADWGTTGDIFVPIEGDYLITAFTLANADPAFLYPGGGYMTLQVRHADFPVANEQQNAPVALDDFPKRSISTLLHLNPATAFSIEITSMDTGTDGIIAAASLTITRTSTWTL